MSRLTPSKPMTDFQLQAALDIIANFTMTLAQAEKLTRAITIEDAQAGWGPDVDDIADQFYTANEGWEGSLEEPEMPYMGATIGADDQRSFA